jgi:hypothetical protein
MMPGATVHFYRGYNTEVSFTRRTLLAALVGFFLFAAASAARTQLVITQRDSGKTIVVRRSVRAVLRLSHRWRWTQPRVSTNAIRLVRVEYVRDPGFDEWVIDRNHRGIATIRSDGTPSCTSCQTKPRSFRVRLRVR